ncbi:MAG: hypothetical protein ABSH09_13755 [Bryobacteraceae bacterium]|jgi:hypothetical protein
MRIVLRSSSLLFSVLGITANVPVHKVVPVLRRGFAGRIRIGAAAGDLFALFGKNLKVDRKSGTIDSFSASPLLQRRPDLSFQLENGLVTSIKVYSRRYKTEFGIGVGDNPAALSNHYRIRWPEDTLAEVETLNMKFRIENDRIVWILLS